LLKEREALQKEREALRRETELRAEAEKSVMLARAVDEPGLSDSLREAVLKHLSSLGH